MSWHISNRLQLGILISWLVAIIGTNVVQAGERAAHVLLLNSYHHGMDWTDGETAGVREVLEKSHRTIELHIEYMDTKRVFDPTHFANLRQMLSHKYFSTKFDAILTTDNDAFDFLRQYRDELFPDVPVVFCGVNFFDDKQLTGVKGYTGVAETFEGASTIDLMLRLHPKTRNIVVVIDSTTTGKAVMAELIPMLTPFCKNVEFKIWNNQTINELRQQLSSLQPDNLVLLMPFARDSAGTFVTYSEIARIVSENSPVPVYGTWDFYLSYGIIGGRLTNAKAQGVASGKLLLQVLNGENVNSIPLQRVAPSQYIFDYHQLERYAIPKSSLPEGSSVLFQPWHEENKHLIWSGVLVLLVFVALSWAFLTNLYRRKQTVLALRDSEMQLNVAQQIAHIGSWELDLLTNTLTWSAEIYRIFEIDPAESSASYEAFLNTIHPDDREAVNAAFTHSLATRTPYIIEHRLQLPDGRIKYVQEQCETFYDAAGKPHRSIGTVQDISKRKKNENDLQYAKEEWERTFDALSDPVMILDLNYRIIKANKAMADALGVTPAKAVGMTCYKAVHGTEAPPDCCPHAKLVGNGQACSKEIHEPRLGGHYLISVSPLHAPDGTLVGSIHAARDISALKKVEEMGRKYTFDLERLLAISRETTMLTELKGLYRVFVVASKELLALDCSTLLLLSEDKKKLTIQDGLGIPQSMIGHFSLVEGQGLSTLVVRTRRPETVLDFTKETRFEVPAVISEKGLLSAVAVPMMMQEEVIGVLIGHTLARREFSRQEIDIYQHIANQAAVAIRNAMSMDLLKKSEKYVRDITDSLGEGVYVLNSLGNVTFMNPEAERLIGWTEQELLHKNIHDIVHNRRADGRSLLFEDCGMQQVIESGKLFYSTDEVFVKKDGTVFPVAVHSAPLLENSKVIASVTAFSDISARRQLEKEREQLIAELQQALTDIKTLHGIVPICASCKKIRDDQGAWHQMEVYISKHTNAQFSHGICKDCAKRLYPDFYTDKID